MKNLNTIILALILAFCSCNTEKKVDDKTNQYPDADAVYIKMVKEYTLNKDKTIDIRYYHRLKYLTHYAIHRLYGETFIIYNPAFMKLNINECQTFMADGSLVKTPENAFNEMLPDFASDIPAYNHIREMVVTHTGLEQNAISELDYTLTSSDEYLPFMSGKEWIQQSSPVKELTIIVNIPEESELNYKMMNTDVVPEITNTDEGVSYKWIYKNIQAYSHEDRQSNHEPYICFSTADDDSDAREFLSDQEAFNFKINEQIKEKTIELTKDLNDPLDKALAIQKFVANNISDYHIPLKYAAWRIRPPEDIWKSYGGTEAEKTVLLSAMLKEAGLIANPVMILKHGTSSDSIACLEDLGHLYVQLIPEGENERVPYLHAFNVNEPYEKSYADVDIIPLDKQSLPISNVSSGNELMAAGSLKFNNNKSITGEITASFKNELCPFGKLNHSRQKAKSLFENVSAANVNKLEKNLAEITFTVNQKEPFLEQQDYLFWNIPHSGAGINSRNLDRLNEKRITPLDLNSIIKESYSYELTLSDKYKLANLTTKIDEQNDVGKVLIEISQNQNVVTIKHNIEIFQKIVSPDDYSKLRELMHIWYNKNYNKLIFRETGEAESI